MLIQIDIDSTLYPSDKLFNKVGKEMEINWPKKYNHWFSYEELFHLDKTPCTLEEMKNLFRKAHSRDYVLQQKPYPHAVKTLKNIVQDYDVEIAYVSDRNEQQHAALHEWLSITGFLSNPDQLVIATKDKRHWMREHKPEIVIDDRVRTLLMARYELGSYGISIEHSHNINLKDEIEDIHIVKDWKEIDLIVRELCDKIGNSSVSRSKEIERRK